MTTSTNARSSIGNCIATGPVSEWLGEYASAMRCAGRSLSGECTGRRRSAQSRQFASVAYGRPGRRSTYVIIDSVVNSCVMPSRSITWTDLRLAGSVRA